jgi:hypothetical protein
MTVSVTPKWGRGSLGLGLTSLLLTIAAAPIQGSPSRVAFSQSSKDIEAYDLVEVTAEIENPDAPNPFVDASLSGSFARSDGTDKREVSGFCDADNGGVFRIRFMPSSPGDYSYSLVYRQGAFEATQSGFTPPQDTAVGPSG